MPTPNEHIYHISRDNLQVFGSLVACPKCGRKIIAEAHTWEPRTVPSAGAVCLECVEIKDQFREQSPEIAAQIEGWKAENQTPKGTS